MVFVRCRTAVLFFAATFLLAPVYGQSNTDAEITFAQEHEEQARQQLRRLLSEYDLDPWIFTRTVKIEAGAVPRSHPIATLNTSNLDADHEQLAVFLHEQIHWFEEQNVEAKERAIEELKEMYPSPPDHEEIGTRSEYSTYLHLIVNWLELDAMTHLIGEKKARTLTAEDDIYRWVNQQVLEDTEKIGAVLQKHDLIIHPSDD